jgi:threonylcarbamoyladenosine tRNA methylthiotransferase MtaB
MKYSVITFGCRVNQADSLGFEEQLRGEGAVATAPENADLVVINTCSVTSGADQSARQAVRRVARLNPGARIIVTGCYATRRPDEVAALPNVARVVHNDAKPLLLSTVAAFLAGPDPTTATRYGDGQGSCGAAIEPGVAGRTAFTLRVQTGCAESCAYCVIPSTRGRPRSVPVTAVLSEVDRVAGIGFKEIALTGVHLGSYGRDLDPPASLIQLLRGLESAPTAMSRRRDLRFRISSLEPADCSLEMVGLVAGSDHFAPHFHLPLQHASNRVLAAMQRPYTIEQYANLLDAIRSAIPGASVGTDVIVGFPGESDADFDELAAYLEQSTLTHVHVFPYSDRPGTSATVMAGKVPPPTVRERARRVREIGDRLSQRFRQSQLGSVQKGLTLEDGSLVVTGNYLKVRIPPGHRRNEWIDVRIESVASAGEITGRPVAAPAA